MAKRIMINALEVRRNDEKYCMHKKRHWSNIHSHSCNQTKQILPQTQFQARNKTNERKVETILDEFTKTRLHFPVRTC